MRRILIAVFAASIVMPSWAAKRITVEQLEQVLNADLAAHKSDVEIAHKIAAIELSERLTQAGLRILGPKFPAGSQSAEALLLLTDRSAFLDPPARELPSTPAPDAATQQHLIQAAQKFAIETLPRLPNLLATRTTYSFDDSAQEVTRGGYFLRLGLHQIGTSKAEVSVHNEKETHLESGVSQPRGGLMTWGEFGSALLIILGDSSQGETTWSHWEQTSSGLMAVFRYQVPKSASHYEIDTSVNEMHADGSSARWVGARASDMGPVSSQPRMIRTRPAYRGSLWIDPAAGTVTRMTLVADLRGNPRFEQAAILVDYGPVQIAGRTLICPVRSLALSSAPPSVNNVMNGTATVWINENRFTNYHLFGSSSRILAERAAQPPSPASPAPENASPGAVPVASLPSPRQQDSAAPPVSTQPAAPSAGVALPSSTATEYSPAAAPAAQPPAPSPLPQQTTPPLPPGTAPQQDPSSVADAPTAPPAALQPSQSPPVPPTAPSASEKGYTLRLEVNSILVPVVVRDKQGRALGDLTAKDFSVFDRGNPRAITGFTLVRSPAPGKAAPTGSAQAPEQDAVSPQNRFVIFLFDDRHLDGSDLIRAQQAALQVFSQPLPVGEYAAVVSLMGVNSGITRDTTALQNAVRKVTVHRSFLHDSNDCPDIDYYSADQILNQRNELEFQIAVAKVDACVGGREVSGGASTGMAQIDAPIAPDQRMAISAAKRALAFGEEDARESLAAVATVVHAMAKLTGQRTVILLSPGFLSLAPDAITFKSDLFDQAAASNVVINALDARGLYAGNVDASQGGSNVFLSQSTGNTSQDEFNSMRESENALSEMANGTGGSFFANNNDLAVGLQSLMAPPEFEYLLEVSLKDVKPTGTYNPLKVKVDRPGVRVQARHGYFSPKKATGRKGAL